MQDGPGADHVHLEKVLVGRLDGGVESGHVDDGVVTGDGGAERHRVEDVGADVGQVEGGRRQVEGRDGAPVPQLVDHVAAQLSARSRDQDPLEGDHC